LFISDSSKQSSASTEPPSHQSGQSGSGLQPEGSETLKTALMHDNVFMDRIVGAVSKKLSANPIARPITENWKFYERAEPTTLTGLLPDDTAPPPHFSNELHENDLNDSFDENQLLRFVPKRFKQKAKVLLQNFDDRPNELTWDSAGTIYADQTSIPNSNIFTLFPYLFRCKVPKDVVSKGFPDFLKKVVEMKLEHLLNCNVTSFIGRDPIVIQKPENSKSSKWWLLI